MMKEYCDRLEALGFSHGGDVGGHRLNMVKTVDADDNKKIDFVIDVDEEGLDLKAYVNLNMNKQYSCKFYEMRMNDFLEPEDLLRQLFETSYNAFSPISARMFEGMMTNR